MYVFSNISNRVQQINGIRIVRQIAERYDQAIVELNRERLNKKGTDVSGVKIRTFKAQGGEVYAPLTIALKRKKGQPTDHVTIRDTGTAQSSMKAEFGRSSFKVSMNEDKPDGKISQNLDVESALGLDESDLGKIRAKVLPQLRRKIYDAML